MNKRTKSAKCVLVGDMYVGKTSLAQVFVNGYFQDNYSASCGGAFMAKTLPGPNITLQLWDTAGMERFRSMVPHFLKDADCAMLVFDTSDRITFLSIRDFWIDFVKQTATSDDIVLLLIGNKTDKSPRQVKEIDARALAEHYGMLYMETSAKTQHNVQALFEKAAQQILDSGILRPKKDYDESILVIPQRKKKTTCCS